MSDKATAIVEIIYALTEACIAVCVIGGATGIAVVSVVRHGMVQDIPSWLAGTVGAVVGFYYGTRHVRQNGSRP